MILAQIKNLIVVVLNTIVIVMGNVSVVVILLAFQNIVNVMKVIQDGTGSRTIAWPDGTNSVTVRWPGDTAPTLSSGAADVDIFVFFTHDGGTNYYGFSAGLDML